jgi:hypothetical protein
MIERQGQTRIERDANGQPIFRPSAVIENIGRGKFQRIATESKTKDAGITYQLDTDMRLAKARVENIESVIQNELITLNKTLESKNAAPREEDEENVPANGATASDATFLKELNAKVDQVRIEHDAQLGMRELPRPESTQARPADMNVWASLFGGNTPAPQPTNGPGHEVRND